MPSGPIRRRPADQRARVDGSLELHVVEAAEDCQYAFSTQRATTSSSERRKVVLQVAQPDHQPDRDARPAQVRVIERAEPRLEHSPNRSGRPAAPGMARIDLLAEVCAKQVVGRLRIARIEVHRNPRISTPGGQLPAIYNIY
jgi:hypothetical protein